MVKPAICPFSDPFLLLVVVLKAWKRKQRLFHVALGWSQGEGGLVTWVLGSKNFTFDQKTLIPSPGESDTIQNV